MLKRTDKRGRARGSLLFAPTLLSESLFFSFFFLFLLFFSLLIFSLPFASALQLSPAAKHFTLDGTGETYTLRVINDQHATLEVSVSAAGELAKSITLSPASFTLSPDQREQEVLVTLAPVDLAALTPGDHAITLKMVALPVSNDGQFGSGVTLLHNLLLLKPYTGAYLDGSLGARTKTAAVVFTLSLSNEGDASTTASGTLLVSGPDDLSGSVAFPPSTIAGLSDGKLEESWWPDALVPGHYVANATLSYDDPVRGSVSSSFLSRFLVGHPSVQLATINPTLSAGKINRIFLPAELEWDEPLDAYAKVTLIDSGAETVVSTTTATETLVSSAPSALVAFLEIPSAAAGNYSLRATVFDAHGTTLGDREWTVPVTGGTPLAAVQSAVRSPVGMLFLLALVLLLLLALALRWHRRRR